MMVRTSLAIFGIGGWTAAIAVALLPVEVVQAARGIELGVADALAIAGVLAGPPTAAGLLLWRKVNALVDAVADVKSYHVTMKEKLDALEADLDVFTTQFRDELRRVHDRVDQQLRGDA